jgi:hypothetical protein
MLVSVFPTDIRDESVFYFSSAGRLGAKNVFRVNVQMRLRKALRHAGANAAHLLPYSSPARLRTGQMDIKQLAI